jgi:threonine dehydrogenase-like Zn-dependent dehydrogenase
VQRYLPRLLALIQEGKIDPSFVISHHLPLEEAPEGYAMFRDKAEQCTKIVLKPGMPRGARASVEQPARSGERLH